MEPYKLNIKVGPHEFHGEGAEESVRRDFEEWKSLISTAEASKAGTNKFTNTAPEAGAGEIDQQQLSKLFINDEKKSLVSLKLLPQTDDRDGDALLLILLGFKLIRQQEEVSVTDLTPALKQSGCTGDRVDRIASRALSQNLLHKGGRAKGSRYSLTNSGIEYAKNLSNSMITA